MNELCRKARVQYDERRETLIARRYKDKAQANIAREKWKLFDAIVFEMADSFSLLPSSTDCVMHASWELASYDYVLSSRLGPRNDEIGHWATKLWERIQEKCDVLIPDLMAWDHLASVLWQGVDPRLGRPHRVSARTPESPSTEKESLKDSQ